MNKFIGKIKNVKPDLFFIYTFLVLILKFSIFVGFVTASGSSLVEIFDGFFKVASYAIFLIFILGYLSISFLFQAEPEDIA
ncbi:hypothetical protein [Clostridium sp. DMHC 10]|uniref:hypothetical protein n=1 Tax=Clostridium sp. DMHC 10 TaxID=747377 RepID=UPI001FA6C15F|nr:hypothetical protein [Clostridium sp. DMHC 10]